MNTAKNIQKPTDLIGKRVGGTNFQPAGCIWARGILEEYFGVPHQEITWVTERPEDVAVHAGCRFKNRDDFERQNLSTTCLRRASWTR